MVKVDIPNRSIPGLVTVITPTYNRAQYLEETIESILSQDYPHIEYIVLDDGSKDATGEILQKYNGKLIAFSHDNHGQAWTVNRGFEHARGEFVCLVNSDDPLPKGAIRQLVEVLQAHPDIALVYPDWNIVDAEGDFIQHISLPEYSYIDMVRWFLCIPGPGTVFRRRLVEDGGGWDPAYHHCPDFEWFVRVGLVGTFMHVGKTLAQWRQHEGSITTSERGLDRAHEYSRLMERFFARDDLPAAVREIEGEALRSAYVTAALMMTHDSSAPGHRFQISDTLSTLLSNPEFRRRPTSRTKDGIIADLVVTLQETGESIARQEEGIAWLRDQIAQQMATISRQEEGIVWLRRQLDERNATIAEQEEGIVWLRRQLDERNATIAEQEEGIAWLRRQLDEKEAAVSL